MAKKKRDLDGMTEDEFNALVDTGFNPVQHRHKPGKGNRTGVWVPPESLLRELEQEGAAEGLTKSAARFNGALGRIFGTTGQKTTTPQDIKFLTEFDEAGKVFAKAHGFELIDDE